jgi:hypothetical protein
MRRGKFDLLDYARGHKSRFGPDRAPDLCDALAGLEIPFTPLLEGASLYQQSVLDLLDGARLERNYRSPAPMRRPLARFLEERNRGVFWLTAPAHVGKTTFVQGLARVGDLASIEPPISEAFSPGRGGRIIAYHCRKEHRTGLAGMMNTLQSRLVQTFNVSENIAHLAPVAGHVIDARSPAVFIDYLEKWRTFSHTYCRVPTSAPLMVAIDGLDEADPPPDASPLDILPSEGALTDGLFLLLTSRPVGDADAPRFLRSHVLPLYPSG